MTQHHPAKVLTTPQGRDAEIDVLLVPLIEALWASGIPRTGGSCQDLGESIQSSQRHKRFLAGYAQVEMPVADACRLLSMAAAAPEWGPYMHWADEGGWAVSVPVVVVFGGTEVAPFAQVRFPASQIDDIVKAIGRDGIPDEPAPARWPDRWPPIANEET